MGFLNSISAISHRAQTLILGNPTCDRGMKMIFNRNLHEMLYFSFAFLSKESGDISFQEKIFANHISDKGLMSKIYEEFIELSIKRTKPARLKNGQRV